MIVAFKNISTLSIKSKNIKSKEKISLKKENLSDL